jgi:ABC-type Na+ transport system ATPase subunit NatA
MSVAKRLIICLILIYSLLLTGCWDVEEINRRASIDAMYLDKGNTEKFKIGVSISVPGTVLPPVVGTEQQFQKRHFIISAEGESMVDAWSKLQAKSERNIFFGQLRTVVLTDKFANENINKLAKLLVMEEYIDRRVGKFSRVMKQKVAIARSIVHNPAVMLFDEPTMGLDVTSSKIVQDFILECQMDSKAIIFSSHSMQEVEKLCDRIVMIHRGRIVEYGRVQDLKNKYGEDLEDVFMRLVGEK